MLAQLLMLLNCLLFTTFADPKREVFIALTSNKFQIPVHIKVGMSDDVPVLFLALFIQRNELDLRNSLYENESSIFWAIDHSDSIQDIVNLSNLFIKFTCDRISALNFGLHHGCIDKNGRASKP